MGSLVCLQAQDEFTTAESKAQSRLHTPAPPSAHARLTEGKLHAAIRKPCSRQGVGVQGAGAVCFGESPQGTQTQPPMPGESLLVFEALS